MEIRKLVFGVRADTTQYAAQVKAAMAVIQECINNELESLKRLTGQEFIYHKGEFMLVVDKKEVPEKNCLETLPLPLIHSDFERKFDQAARKRLIELCIKLGTPPRIFQGEEPEQVVVRPSDGFSCPTCGCGIVDTTTLASQHRTYSCMNKDCQEYTLGSPKKELTSEQKGMLRPYLGEPRLGRVLPKLPAAAIKEEQQVPVTGGEAVVDRGDLVKLFDGMRRGPMKVEGDLDLEEESKKEETWRDRPPLL